MIDDKPSAEVAALLAVSGLDMDEVRRLCGHEFGSTWAGTLPPCEARYDGPERESCGYTEDEHAAARVIAWLADGSALPECVARVRRLWFREDVVECNLSKHEKAKLFWVTMADVGEWLATAPPREIAQVHAATDGDAEVLTAWQKEAADGKPSQYSAVRASMALERATITSPASPETSTVERVAIATAERGTDSRALDGEAMQLLRDIAFAADDWHSQTTSAPVAMDLIKTWIDDASKGLGLGNEALGLLSDGDAEEPFDEVTARRGANAADEQGFPAVAELLRVTTAHIVEGDDASAIDGLCGDALAEVEAAPVKRPAPGLVADEPPALVAGEALREAVAAWQARGEVAAAVCVNRLREQDGPGWELEAAKLLEVAAHPDALANDDARGAVERKG